MEFLIPREYQLKLIEQAKKENVICMLPTGTGKTLVAAMVIKHVLDVQAQSDDPTEQARRAVFIVNTVPLVLQQYNALRNQLGNCYSVGHYSGEAGVDTWDTEQWSKEYTNKHVLVMTAQIFLDNLRHAVISMDRLSLLVFDECHHARKRHPYNQIMAEFYFTPTSNIIPSPAPLVTASGTSRRPKILGLTASPAKNGTKKLESVEMMRVSLLTLERNLNSRITTAAPDCDDLSLSLQPTEFIHFFASCADDDSSELKQESAHSPTCQFSGRNGLEIDSIGPSDQLAQTSPLHQTRTSHGKLVPAFADPEEGQVAIKPVDSNERQVIPTPLELNVSVPLATKETQVALTPMDLEHGDTVKSESTSMLKPFILSTEQHMNGKTNCRAIHHAKKSSNSHTTHQVRGHSDYNSIPMDSTTALQQSIRALADELGLSIYFDEESKQTDDDVVYSIQNIEAQPTVDIPQQPMDGASVSEQDTMPQLPPPTVLNPVATSTPLELSSHKIGNFNAVNSAGLTMAEFTFLKQQVLDFSQNINIDNEQAKLFQTILRLVQELGVWCATHFVYLLLNTSGAKSASAAQPVRNALISVLSLLLSTFYSDADLEDCASQENAQTNNESILRKPATLSDSDQSRIGRLLCRRPHSKKLLSPQVWDLFCLILGHRNCLAAKGSGVDSRLCGIIFVQCRDTAFLLARLINVVFANEIPPLRAAHLVGNSDTFRHNFPQIGGKEGRQSRVIEKFRQSQLELLVATSVAEEGLDVQHCQLVVRFNPLQTLVGYVQSRGRARHAQAVYVVMLERANKKQVNDFDKLKRCDALMQTFARLESHVKLDSHGESLRELLIQGDSDPIVNICNRPVDDKFSPSNYAPHVLRELWYAYEGDEPYSVQSTGALVSVNSAVSLVYRYCDHLPRDDYCAMQPVFETERDPKDESVICFPRYQVTLRLPANGALREVKGRWRRTRPEARRSACLEAVRQLHKAGALNEYLMVPSADREARRDNWVRCKMDKILHDEMIDEKERGEYDVEDVVREAPQPMGAGPQTAAGQQRYKDLQFHVFDETRQQRLWNVLRTRAETDLVPLYLHRIRTTYNNSTTYLLSGPNDVGASKAATAFALLCWSPLPAISPYIFIDRSTKDNHIALIESSLPYDPDTIVHVTIRQLAILQRYHELLLSAVLPSTQYEFMLTNISLEFSPIVIVPLTVALPPPTRPQNTDYYNQPHLNQIYIEELQKCQVDWAELDRVMNFPSHHFWANIPGGPAVLTRAGWTPALEKLTVAQCRAEPKPLACLQQSLTYAQQLQVYGPCIDLLLLHSTNNPLDEDRLTNLLNTHLIVCRSTQRRMQFRLCKDVADLRKLRVELNGADMGVYYDWLCNRWKTETALTEAVQWDRSIRLVVNQLLNVMVSIVTKNLKEADGMNGDCKKGNSSDEDDCAEDSVAVPYVAEPVRFWKSELDLQCNPDGSVPMVLACRAPSIDSLVTPVKTRLRIKIESKPAPPHLVSSRLSLQFTSMEYTEKVKGRSEDNGSGNNGMETNVTSESAVTIMDTLRLGAKSNLGQNVFFLTDVDVHPIHLKTVNDALHVPGLLWHVHQCATVSKFRQKYLPRSPPSHELLLREALSSPSAGHHKDYERLETLGDSLLKFLTTLHLVISNPTCYEGRLTRLKNAIISNKNLCRLSIANEIPPYILTAHFNSAEFVPHGYAAAWERFSAITSKPRHSVSKRRLIGADEFDPEAVINRCISQGQLADVMEAILAAYFLCHRHYAHNDSVHDDSRRVGVSTNATSTNWTTGPFETALKLLWSDVLIPMNFIPKPKPKTDEKKGENTDGNSKEMNKEVEGITSSPKCTDIHTGTTGPLEYPDIRRWIAQTRDPVLVTRDTQLACMSESDRAAVVQLEELVGISFDHPSLLLEAITHPTYDDCYPRRNYQVLELLGDAVLDASITDYLFEWDWECHLSPGDLSDLRSYCVRNDTLALVCVDLGLHRLLRHRSDRLAQDVHAFEVGPYATVKASLCRWRERCRQNMIEDTTSTQAVVGECFRESLNPTIAPKALGDLVESLLGAAFAESGGSISLVRRLVQKWIVEPFLTEVLEHSRFDPWGPHRSSTVIMEEARVIVGCSEYSVDLVTVDKSHDTTAAVESLPTVDARANRGTAGGVSFLPAGVQTKGIKRRPVDPLIEMQDDEEEIADGLDDSIDKEGEPEASNSVEPSPEPLMRDIRANVPGGTTGGDIKSEPVVHWRSLVQEQYQAWDGYSSKESTQVICQLRVHGQLVGEGVGTSSKTAKLALAVTVVGNDPHGHLNRLRSLCTCNKSLKRARDDDNED